MSISLCRLSANEKLKLVYDLKVGDNYRIDLPMRMPFDMVIALDSSLVEQIKQASDSIKTADDIDSTAIIVDNYQQAINIDMTMRMILNCKVYEVKDDVYVLGMYYERLEYKSKTPDAEYEFNSMSKINTISEDTKVEFDKLKSIIGKKFIVELNKNGDIIDIKNYDKIEKYLTISNSTEVDASKSSSLAQQLDGNSLKTNLTDIFGVLPKKSVSVGDYWTKEVVVKDDMMPYINKTRYTLKAIEDDELVIQAESIVYSDKMNTNVFYSEGDGSSMIRINKNDLFLQTQNSTVDLDMSMNLLGMDFKIKSKIETNYSVSKIN